MALGKAFLYSECISKRTMWELFNLPVLSSFIKASAFWKIFATVCDFPEPLAPTIAKCLLKNLFPSTGTEIDLLVASFEKLNWLSFGTLPSKMSLIYFSEAGFTSLGGIDRVSPPRVNLPSSIIPKGLASII